MGELGFDPISTIFTGAALKNVFGIGKKKAARDQNVSTHKGFYTSQFPPQANFKPLLDRIGAQSGLGKRQGAKNMREDYQAMFNHKDSWLVKNKVASPEDYAAYNVLQWINMDIGCDKNAKPGTSEYAHCPRYLNTDISIFDTQRIQEYEAKQAAKKAPAPKRPPVKTVKQPPMRSQPVKQPPRAAPPKVEILPPQPTTAAPTSLQPTGPGFDLTKILELFGQRAPEPQFIPQAPAQPAAPVETTPKWLLPAALAGGAGIIALALTGGKKKRR
jgi:hypothetical protein